MNDTIPFFDFNNLVFVGDQYTVFVIETEKMILNHNGTLVCRKTDMTEVRNYVNTLRYPDLLEVYTLT
jgi:hypothetical protein